jgi:hypothetical protein
MRVTYACGHTAEISDNPSGAPVCGCGETRIQYVKARAPRFTGACTGPFAEFKNLEPIAVNLAPGGPLTIKADA